MARRNLGHWQSDPPPGCVKVTDEFGYSGWWCTSCDCPVDKWHLSGARHAREMAIEDRSQEFLQWLAREQERRKEAPEDSEGRGETPTSTPKSESDKLATRSWMESRDGEWYCCLCKKWATDMHLASENHLSRALHPEWYGYGDDAEPGLQPGEQTVGASGLRGSSTLDGSIRP